MGGNGSRKKKEEASKFWPPFAAGPTRCKQIFSPPPLLFPPPVRFSVLEFTASPSCRVCVCCHSNLTAPLVWLVRDVRRAFPFLPSPAAPPGGGGIALLPEPGRKREKESGASKQSNRRRQSCLPPLSPARPCQSCSSPPYTPVGGRSKNSAPCLFFPRRRRGGSCQSSSGCMCCSSHRSSESLGTDLGRGRGKNISFPSFFHDSFGAEFF